VTQTVHLKFHTNAGTTLETFIEQSIDQEPDEVAADLANELQETDDRGRHVTRWMSIGHLTIFSGAICAVEADIHDRDDESQEG